MNLNTNVDILLIENKRLQDIEHSLTRKLRQAEQKITKLKEIINNQNLLFRDIESKILLSLDTQQQSRDDLARIRSERDYYKRECLRILDSGDRKRRDSVSSTQTVKDNNETVAENAKLKHQQVMLVKTIELLYKQIRNSRNSDNQSHQQTGDEDLGTPKESSFKLNTDLMQIDKEIELIENM